MEIKNGFFFRRGIRERLCAHLPSLKLFHGRLSASISAACKSSDPLAIHHRLMICFGTGKHTKIMNITTPCSAIKISKNASGDGVAEVPVIVAAKYEIISNTVHNAITVYKNAVLFALQNRKSELIDKVPVPHTFPYLQQDSGKELSSQWENLG